MFRAESNEVFSRFNLLGVNIVALFENNPSALKMNRDWFDSRFKDIDFAGVNMVLISDSRSYFLVDYILNIPEFRGFILITQASYRVGRMLCFEDYLLVNDQEKVLDTDTRVSYLNFYQPFSFREITAIPFPNGCGIGSCNWHITKNNDPELVDFSAFIITGHCMKTCYLNPTSPSKADIICILPSAIQTYDFVECISQISMRIKSLQKNSGRVVIPSYIDDTFYLLLWALRELCNIDTHFLVLSHTYQSLINILSAMHNDHELEDIPHTDTSSDANSTLLNGRSIFFAPHPTLQYGQILAFTLNMNEHIHFLNIYNQIDNMEYIPFSTNTGIENLRMYINNIESKAIILPDPTLLTDIPSLKPYPYEIAVSDSIVRWIDMKPIDDDPNERAFQIISGCFEAERIGGLIIHDKYLMNPPDMKRFIECLIEQGATDIIVNELIIKCKFSFIEGDNEATISYENESIEIETGCGRIEEVILSILKM